MKALNYYEMSLVNGGSAKNIVADIGCLGVGLSFGLVNPLLGAIMGIGCGLAVYYKS
jgi:hypothetical protein